MLLDVLVAMLITVAISFMAMPYVLVRYQRAHTEAVTPLFQDVPTSR